MKIFNKLFYATLAIGTISLLVYILGDESSKYTRIFMGLFTGSTLGCVTALINYLGARKQFLEDKYKVVTQMMVNLYGIKSIILDIEFSCKNSTIDYDVIKNADSKISAIYELAVRVNTSTADNELIGYTPLFCKSSINGVFASLQLDMHKSSSDLFNDLNEFRINHLKFLSAAQPMPAFVEEAGGVININRYDCSEYLDNFQRDIASIHKSVDDFIANVYNHMTAVDKAQNTVDKKWSETERIFTETLNKKDK